MRIVFIGSAALACPSLEMLLGCGPAQGSLPRGHIAETRQVDEVVAVVTQPDRPKGRNLKISSCAVKVLAVSKNLTVLPPRDVNSPDSIDTLRRLKPDLIVVVAYGQILKKEILALPPEGCVNVHASLLPKYRGAAPIQWAIANGEQVTGVTTMFMSEGMDDGDIILQKEVAIGREDTAGSLYDRLAQEGAVLLSETVEAIRNGRAIRIPQIGTEATFAPKLNKEDGRIDWSRPAEEIYNKVRGFNPWPCCWCFAPVKGGQPPSHRSGVMAGQGGQEEKKKNGKLRVFRVRVEEAEGKFGEVVDMSGDGPLVGTGDKSVRLLEVQPEGKKVMSGDAYLRGHGLKVGDKVF